MESPLNITEITNTMNFTILEMSSLGFPNGSFMYNSDDLKLFSRASFLNKLSVKILLIIAYTFVFCCCFIGNSLVIAVLTLNREMHSTTNFCLTNLAIADLCVGLFCVYQNLSLYLSSGWALGDLLCRMYHFVHALSYTASVCLLVVIAIERYLVLVHPLWARRVLTMNKLRISVIFVWIISAVCCFPRFLIYETIKLEFPTADINTSDTKAFCILKQRFYDQRIYDVTYITLCYATPLIIICVLYLRVCYHLWTSGIPGSSVMSTHDLHLKTISTESFNSNHSSIASFNLLSKKRRKVIKLLIVIVLAFAIFSLPFHARKLIQHYLKSYNVSSQYASMFTIFTTLFLYMNSGINPLLYAFYSKKLRKLIIRLIIRTSRCQKSYSGDSTTRVSYNRNNESVKRMNCTHF